MQRQHVVGDLRNPGHAPGHALGATQPGFAALGRTDDRLCIERAICSMACRINGLQNLGGPELGAALLRDVTAIDEVIAARDE